MSTPEVIRLTLQCEDHAAEEAGKDLDFAGPSALNRFKLTEQDKRELRAALIGYARRGAGRAVAHYRLHRGEA